MFVGAVHRVLAFGREVIQALDWNMQIRFVN